MKAAEHLWQLFRALGSSPRSAGAILHDNRYWEDRFRKRHEHATPLPLLDISVLVPANTELHGLVFLGSGSTIPDLIVLQHLAMRPGTKSYFEIGTWRGESMSIVLPHVERACSLDLDKKTMERIGFSKKRQEQMYTLLDDTGKLTFLQGDSHTFDFSSIGEHYDLFLIDGNHTYDSVLSDTRQVLEYLAHEASIVVWHDYAHDPEEVRWEVYSAILEAVPPELHAHLYHVSHTKCAVLLKDKHISGTPARFPLQSRYRWNIHLKRSE